MRTAGSQELRCVRRLTLSQAYCIMGDTKHPSGLERATFDRPRNHECRNQVARSNRDRTRSDIRNGGGGVGPAEGWVAAFFAI